MDRRCRPPKRRSYGRGEHPLGRRMYSRGIVLRGRVGVRTWKALLVAIARAMDMDPVGEAVVWRYPVYGRNNEGKGGFGQTIMQPITQSFIVVDTWPDHDGAYLFICSCKRWWPAQLRETIAFYGLYEDQVSAPITLSLK